MYRFTEEANFRSVKTWACYNLRRRDFSTVDKCKGKQAVNGSSVRIYDKALL